MEISLELDRKATELTELFAHQRAFAPKLALTTATERIEKLRRLLGWMKSNQLAIEQALYDDFRRPGTETVLGELMGVTAEIRHLIKNLKTWMKPRRVPTPLALMGTAGYVKYEPKGNALILSPWNYPYNLSVKPMAMAIGAGCTVLLKPSELTPHTSALLQRMVDELFSTEEVAVVEGDASVAESLLKLPFNHVYFTGSPAVGKIVMTAAAKHLASVTLELGGKSPCVIDETVDVKKMAERVAWGKFFNNGQTCIAPDYLLVQERVQEQFLAALKYNIERMYNPEGRGVETSPDFCRIVNACHFGRVSGLVADAVEKGAQVVQGGQTDQSQNFIAPTILTHVFDEMRVMQEEIFGPVLPVISYKNREEVVQRIQAGEKPLALYIGSRNEDTIRYLLQNTSSGGVVINETLIQYGHTELPWGGINNSGIGKSGGHWGFLEFTNQRGVLRQRFGTVRFLYPPYTSRVRKMVQFFLRFV
ncbi:MAG: aldehyde dehydrogenase family protein [Sphingobacteriaceae bacterium]|nr:aldehyde dehydrogenase family protein [Cytophagaceae bacterium]